MRVLLAILVLFPVLACSAGPESSDPGRPAAWATPVEKPGLPNLNRVNDDLYRGAQPTAEGMRELEKMGIRTVVNLRATHSDRDELEGTGLKSAHIPMTTFHPEDEDLVRFLRIWADPANRPIFVHCQHGSDRTGMVLATYRIVVEGWSKEDAIREMTQGGYGFHTIWGNLVDHVREMDVDRIRREAGLDR